MKIVMVPECEKLQVPMDSAVYKFFDLCVLYVIMR